jgi:hypothetical protein
VSSDVVRLALVLMNARVKHGFPVAIGERRSTTAQLLFRALASTALLEAICWPVFSEIVPAPLPDPKIQGYTFPEREATILGWIADLAQGQNTPAGKQAFDNLYLHGWGIWTALTSATGQVFEGQNLLVFETWTSPSDLQNHLETKTLSALLALRSPPSLFEEFDQLKISGKIRPQILEGGAPNGENRVVGFVKYDPTAAAHIQSQGLLQRSVLDQLAKAGAKQIQQFPTSALALKPVFKILTADTLVGGRYFQLKVWTGPPSMSREWPEQSWPGCVWIDINGGGTGSGKIDLVGKPDWSSRTEDTTYPISSLVNFRLTRQQAISINAQSIGGIREASTGDFAILVAMHVAGREITRWTWQTFWWSPTPNDPQLPSSKEIAALKPTQLQGAARNYAMSLGYSMLSPSEPYVGGTNKGESVYVYNPYLEAGFGPQDLPDSIAGISDGKSVSNNYGVQTNCMSCHGSANYNPSNSGTAPQYCGDRYLDLDDPRFLGTLQVDFLWSLPIKAK